MFDIVALAVYLIVKIFLIKKDIAGIGREFNEKLKADTNTLITVDGKDKTVCRLAADINEQLKVLRKQRLKYEQGDLELKSAVANISHDLRTPLTAISGYLELLDKDKKSRCGTLYRHYKKPHGHAKTARGRFIPLFRDYFARL